MNGKLVFALFHVNPRVLHSVQLNMSRNPGFGFSAVRGGARLSWNMGKKDVENLEGQV